MPARTWSNARGSEVVLGFVGGQLVDVIELQHPAVCAGGLQAVA
jgi:hypothetical protein